MAPSFTLCTPTCAALQFAIYYRHEEDCKCTHCWREVQHVNLKVVDEDGIEVYFKCNANRPLGKLMDAYCNRLPQSRDGVRFMFDGVQIEEAQTPAQLGMKDGDVRSGVEPLTLYLSSSQIVCPRASDHRRDVQKARKKAEVFVGTHRRQDDG